MVVLWLMWTSYSVATVTTNSSVGVLRALTKHLWCKLLRAMNVVSIVRCENWDPLS